MNFREKSRNKNFYTKCSQLYKHAWITRWEQIKTVISLGWFGFFFISTFISCLYFKNLFSFFVVVRANIKHFKSKWCIHKNEKWITYFLSKYLLIILQVSLLYLWMANRKRPRTYGEWGKSSLIQEREKKHFTLCPFTLSRALALFSLVNLLSRVVSRSSPILKNSAWNSPVSLVSLAQHASYSIPTIDLLQVPVNTKLLSVK